MGKLGAWQLANIANGVANSGRDNCLSMLFAPLATAVRRRVGGFIPQELANTARAFARGGQNDASLFAALAAAAERLLGDSNAPELANTA